jgi:hypothetical protein
MGTLGLLFLVMLLRTGYKKMFKVRTNFIYKIKILKDDSPLTLFLSFCHLHYDVKKTNFFVLSVFSGPTIELLVLYIGSACGFAVWLLLT